VKMSPGKYMVIPTFIALQAFILMVLTPFVPLNGTSDGGGLITWISFQAWAMYFLGGCTPKMAVKTVIGYAGGILASIAIFELAGLFAGLNSPPNFLWGLNLAVFLVVIPVICMEKVAWCDFIPAWFVGAGVFFALMTYLAPPEEMHKCTWYTKVATAEMVACVVGLVFGACTVYFRGWYEAKFGEPAEEAAE